MEYRADVAIVGAGPVGCVAALAHARTGRKVILIEANPTRKNRFAGELLHPAAVSALSAVGIHSIPCANDHLPNRGFAISSVDPDYTTLLDHPGAPGITFEFNHFVDHLRERAIATPGVQFLPHHRVVDLKGDTLVCKVRDGEDATIRADRIIGADGRFSVIRKLLGIEDDRAVLSYMAGLLLKDVTLPHEGYGHVMWGKAGPVLAYRIEENGVRVCIDVPTVVKKRKDAKEAIWNLIEAQLPEALKQPIHDELMNGSVLWAVNELRPRIHYGKGKVALVGDAVGHFHPMTGAGMTMGFGDALELAACDDLERYRARRHVGSLSPAMLATALYEIFAVRSAPTLALRKAIFDIWAEEPVLRERSMAFLAGTDPSLPRLLNVGMRMVVRAFRHVVRDAARERDIGHGIDGGRGIAGLVRWLLTESVPPSMQILKGDLPLTPFEQRRLLQQQQLDYPQDPR